MLTSLQELNIAGSFIRQLTLFPGKKLEIRLLHGPVGKEQGEVVEEIDLAFHGLTICGFDLRADPWIEIISLETESNSSVNDDPLNDDSSKGETPKGESPARRRFQLLCCEGRIEILAERFTSTIVDEITFVDRLPGSDDFYHSNASLSLDESREIRCGFCGRERVDVSKIITGSEANICADCIRICVDLIEPEPKSTS